MPLYGICRRCFVSVFYVQRIFVLRIFCLSKKAADVSELIQGFHFEPFADVLFKDLSTGNRKKAYLITAFALKPELLLLDEPVNGLDFESTEYLYQQIAGYKQYGTVLFSSHILESITLTSDRVFVLENGQIRQTFEGGQIHAAKIREALQRLQIGYLKQCCATGFSRRKLQRAIYQRQAPWKRASSSEADA